MDGFLIIDKSGGMTSRDVVNIAQRWFPRGTRIGHAGTLDPLATGVLVLCVGKATRSVNFIHEFLKSYMTRIRLGASSNTDDADGTISFNAQAIPPELAAVQELFSTMIGVISQRPPTFSAVKVAGQRAYRKARLGQQFELNTKPVRIESIEIESLVWPFLDLKIVCGKGTYIRSIARDVGEALKVGGLVQTLRRTQIGPFHVKNALTLDCSAETARSRLIPTEFLANSTQGSF